MPIKICLNQHDLITEVHKFWVRLLKNSKRSSQDLTKSNWCWSKIRHRFKADLQQPISWSFQNEEWVNHLLCKWKDCDNNSNLTMLNCCRLIVRNI
jgi:hypothetical protein